MRTKFIPECRGSEGEPKPQTQTARNVEIFEYTDGSKDIFCPNLSDQTCTISQSADVCVFLSGKAEKSKIPPLFQNKENEARASVIYVDDTRVKMERKYNEFNREITAQYIKEHDGISRIELAKTFGLDKGMVTRIVQSLLREDRIKEEGTRKGKGAGRPVKQLHYNNKYQEPDDRKTIKELMALKSTS